MGGLQIVKRLQRLKRIGDLGEHKPIAIVTSSKPSIFLAFSRVPLRNPLEIGVALRAIGKRPGASPNRQEALMDAAVVQNQLTEQLTQQLEESKYLHIPLMNRIEGRIRTEEQLAKYTAVLVQKLEQREFRDEWLIDRIDRMLDLQQRLARYESSVDGGRSA
jgi:hypothetical protein